MWAQGMWPSLSSTSLILRLDCLLVSHVLFVASASRKALVTLLVQITTNLVLHHICQDNWTHLASNEEAHCMVRWWPCHHLQSSHQLPLGISLWHISLRNKATVCRHSWAEESEFPDLDCSKRVELIHWLNTCNKGCEVSLAILANCLMQRILARMASRYFISSGVHAEILTRRAAGCQG